MPRKLSLFTGPWSDLPLADIAARASEWGYQGLDIACWGEHLEVQKALSEPAYCQSILSLMEQHELTMVAVSNHPVGQLVSGTPHPLHQNVVPEWVWGDGQVDGVSARAAQEMLDTGRVAQQLGVNLVVGSTGSPFTALLFEDWLPGDTAVQLLWNKLNEQWKPILDAYRDLGCQFACELSPNSTAFDFYSAERTIEALHGHQSFGFALAPAALHWQGVDPCEIIRSQRDRLWNVRVQDAAITLNGRSGLLGSLLSEGDPQRGWQHRALGMGNIDWTAVMRALHQVNYTGPLTVAFRDHDVNRDYAAAQAVELIHRLDFEPVQRHVGLFG